MQCEKVTVCSVVKTCGRGSMRPLRIGYLIRDFKKIPKKECERFFLKLFKCVVLDQPKMDIGELAEDGLYLYLWLLTVGCWLLAAL